MVKSNMNFIIACKYGKYNDVKFHINNYVDILYKDEDGDTGLMYACRGNFHKIVKLIIDHNKETMLQCNNYQDTALTLACFYNAYKSIEILIKNGVDLEQQNKYNETGFTIACQKYHVDIIKLLIKRNVNINHQNKFGDTGLMYICQRGDEHIAELLINKNVDIYKQNERYNTCFHIACQYNKINIIKLLIKHHFNVEYQNNFGHTGFTIACLYQNIETIKLLLKNNVNYEHKIKNGITGLVYIFREKNIELIELLLNYIDIDNNLKYVLMKYYNKLKYANDLNIQNFYNNFLKLNISDESDLDHNAIISYLISFNYYNLYKKLYANHIFNNDQLELIYTQARCTKFNQESLNLNKTYNNLVYLSLGID